MATENITVVHAEAWDNVMPPTHTPGGALHVVCEINSNNHGRHFLHRRVPQGINPRILLLEIKVLPGKIFIHNPQHLTYSQDLAQVGQYTSIEIFSGSQLLTTIDNIPVVS